MIKELKKDSTLAHIPVLFISAFADKFEMEAGLKLGASEYIIKPFEPEELLAKIAVHLSSL